MKTTFTIITVLLSFITSAQQLEKRPQPERKSFTINSLGNELRRNQFRSNKFFYKENHTADRIKIKHKELHTASSVISIDENFFFINRDVKDFENIEYSLVMLNSKGQNPVKTKIVKAFEKGSQYKSGPAPGSIQLAMMWGTKLMKSPNDKFIAMSVAKSLNDRFNYYNLSRTSKDVQYKEYGEQTEKFHIGIIDSKLNVLKKGTYDFGIKRNEIEYTKQHLDKNGNLLIFVKLVAYKYAGNEAYIIKITPDEMEPIKKKISLIDYHLLRERIYFKGDSLFVCGAATELEEPRIKGIYSGIFNLKNMEMNDFISLFDQDQIDFINEFSGRKKGKEYVVTMHTSGFTSDFKGGVLYSQLSWKTRAKADNFEYNVQKNAMVLGLSFETKKIELLEIIDLPLVDVHSRPLFLSTAADGVFYCMTTASEENNVNITFPVLFKIENFELEKIVEFKDLLGQTNTQLHYDYQLSKDGKSIEFCAVKYKKKRPKYSFYRYYFE